MNRNECRYENVHLGIATFMFFTACLFAQATSVFTEAHQKAAERGFAFAQYDLGEMYAIGEGVLEDRAEAVKWYRWTAEQGLLDARYNVAIMFKFSCAIIASGVFPFYSYLFIQLWFRRYDGI